MKPKADVLRERIKRIEEDITRGREFLETGAHGEWHGFRAHFGAKMRDGKVLPPHRDWVKNVLLPAQERALREAEKLLERFEHQEASSAGSRPGRRDNRMTAFDEDRP